MSTISAIQHIAQQVSIYLDIPILVTGLVGNALCVVVFTSLRTFRHNPCSFYLTSASLVNIGQLLTGLLSLIFMNGFGLNWTTSSLSYCKIRPLLAQACALISLTCICLATVDQYVKTCTRPCYQHMSNIKVARRLVIAICLVWLLHGIPFSVTSDIRNSTCTFYNSIFLHYYSQFYFPILRGLLPFSIMNLFCLLAFRNVRQMTRRPVPIIRRELDKQLTLMVLVQVIFTTVTTIPFVIQMTYMQNTTFTDPTIAAKEKLINEILMSIFYANYSAQLYIYYCSSIRFRKQLHYVLIKIHFQRWRRAANPQNQMDPHNAAVYPISTINH